MLERYLKGKLIKFWLEPLEILYWYVYDLKDVRY